MNLIANARNLVRKLVGPETGPEDGRRDSTSVLLSSEPEFWSGHDPTDPTGSAGPVLAFTSPPVLPSILLTWVYTAIVLQSGAPCFLAAKRSSTSHHRIVCGGGFCRKKCIRDHLKRCKI